MNQNPEIIQGGNHQDDRGKLTFVNDFNLAEIKRYYIIEHSNTNVIRAWQGHKREQKWFQVISGSFLVAVVKPDNWENPSNDIKIERFILESDNSQVLQIPGGFANGFKALETNSKMIVFSDLTLEEAANDNYRFDSHLWFDWK